MENGGLQGAALVQGCCQGSRQVVPRTVSSHAKALTAFALSPRPAANARCALVLLLDQFPRNAFRGTAEMFQYDALAQSWARRAKEPT